MNHSILIAIDLRKCPFVRAKWRSTNMKSQVASISFFPARVYEQMEMMIMMKKRFNYIQLKKIRACDVYNLGIYSDISYSIMTSFPHPIPSIPYIDDDIPWTFPFSCRAKIWAAKPTIFLANWWWFYESSPSKNEENLAVCSLYCVYYSQSLQTSLAYTFDYNHWYVPPYLPR